MRSTSSPIAGVLMALALVFLLSEGSRATAQRPPVRMLIPIVSSGSALGFEGTGSPTADSPTPTATPTSTPVISVTIPANAETTLQTANGDLTVRFPAGFVESPTGTVAVQVSGGTRFQVG